MEEWREGAGSHLRRPHRRCSMVCMCVAIELSVPMPCCSIKPISSLSASGPGGLVIPSSNSSDAIAAVTSCRSLAPSRSSAVAPAWAADAVRIHSGRGEACGARCGSAPYQPSTSSSRPLTVNASPPTSTSAHEILSCASGETEAKKVRLTSSYTRHAVCPPHAAACSRVAACIGVIGGWSPTSTAPLRARTCKSRARK